MKARDIMTPAPRVVTPDQPISEAARLMAQTDVGMIPVVHDLGSMKLEGVITDRDIAIRHVAEQHVADCPVAMHMTIGRLDTIRLEDHVHDVIGRMKHDRVRRMLVVDEDHRLVGIIAQADIARQVGPQEPKEVEQLLEALSS